jgi:uncharacterized membrane protein YfcA
LTYNAAALNLWLFVLAFAISVFGSLVGLGGGFILVPLLRLLFGLPPAITAGSSLALVVTNNAMASIAYFRQRRIDLEIGLLIAAGGLPGSIIGALTVRTMSTRVFDWLLAILTLAVAVDMLVYGRARAAKLHRYTVTRPARRFFAAGFGVVVGLLSGLFGAGGGIILVSALFYLTDLSPHEVTATTQFTILLVATFGLLAHGFAHDLRLNYALPLVLGGLLGGPIGAHLSLRVRPHRLVSLVAVALMLAACALVARDIFP